MSFATPKDRVYQLTLADAYTSGSGEMVLTSLPSGGFTFPIYFAAITAASYGTGVNEVTASYTATGISGNTLTGVAVLAGSTDQNFSAGDYVEERNVAQYVIDLNTATAAIQTALNSVPSGVLKGVDGVLEAATAGTDYVTPSGSITGSAATITGNIAESQVTGLASSLAALMPALNPKSKTANYSAGASDFVACDCSGGSFTVMLPDAPASGTLIGVKAVNIGSGTNTVTVETQGSDVFNRSGGSTSATLEWTGQGFIWLYLSGIWYALAADSNLSDLAAGANVTLTTSSGKLTVASSGGYSGPAYTFVTSSGSYTIPTWATEIELWMMAGGCGGGSGARQASGTAAWGGGGGAGGGAARAIYHAADLLALGSSITLTIGSGGAGGAAPTSDSTNGNSGSLGGVTSAAISSTTICECYHGLAGAGGTTTSGSAGSGLGAPFAGGSGGNSTVTGTANSGIAPTYGYGAAGGGGGGGLSSGGTAYAGGAGGPSSYPVSNGSASTEGSGGAAGSGASGGTGGNGSAPITAFSDVAMTGGGGGGGGATNSSSYYPGQGGSGMLGSGGGGGGAMINGVAINSGNASSYGGGAGGGGWALIIAR